MGTGPANAMDHRYRALVAHADEGLSCSLAAGLAAGGFLADYATTACRCLAALEAQRYDAVVFGPALEQLDVAELVEHARRARSQAAIVVLADGGDPRQAVRLARLGLDDYLPSSWPAAAVASRLLELVDRYRIEPAVETVLTPVVMIGRSRALQEVFETIRLVATKRSTVLISGPTGTGKELAARLTHALSPRAGMPMVTVNCGAFPEALLEAELFGHVKGAFTGAVASRIGRFEQAQASTLFLDEVGDLPLSLQPKVLRVLQEREFQRLGSSETLRVDVRVIAATNCDLAEKVRRSEFREDLYYRLNVVPVVMPGLAERLEDLPAMVDHFIQKVSRRENIPAPRVSSATLGRLMQYHWPGNVRQLENAVEKAVVLAGDRLLLYPSDFTLPAPDPGALSPASAQIRLPAGGLDLEAVMRRLELSLLEQALDRAAGNKKRAAEILGLKRTTLSAKLKRSGS